MANVFSDYEDQGGQRTSAVLFLCIALFLFTAFNFVPVPTQEFADQRLETLMLEQMIFETFQDRGAADEDNADEAELVEELEDDPNLINEVETEELARLLEAFGPPSPIEDVGGAEVTVNVRGTPSAVIPGELDVESLELDAPFGSRAGDVVFDLDPQFRGSGSGQTTRRLSPGLLADGVPSEGRTRLRHTTGIGGDGEGLNLERQDHETPDLFRPDRDVREPPELTQADFNVNTDGLVDWILANQGPLDPGIRAHFQYSPGKLTATTQMSVDGHAYGLQLMHAPGGGETHIALLDGSEIFYFIDPGLQQRASYFQKGLVRRDEDTSVVLVESEDFSARSAEALHFFKIFLAWWDEVREEA